MTPLDFIHPEDAAALRQMESIPGYAALDFYLQMNPNPNAWTYGDTRYIYYCYLQQAVSGGANSTASASSFTSPQKFCTNCGSNIDSTAKFCPDCGKKVE